jgi:hypothetical protein
VLNGDLAAILLAQESSDNRAFVASLVGAGDVVGDLQKREGMKRNLEAI